MLSGYWPVLGTAIAVISREDKLKRSLPRISETLPVEVEVEVGPTTCVRFATGSLHQIVSDSENV
jgi:hypothetical protein